MPSSTIKGIFLAPIVHGPNIGSAAPIVQGNSAAPTHTEKLQEDVASLERKLSLVHDRLEELEAAWYVRIVNWFRKVFSCSN
jgi:hypothetical protein